MNMYRVFFCVILMIAVPVLSGTLPEEKVPAEDTTGNAIALHERTVENNAFVVGEYLLFLLRWGLIRGGFATLEVDRVEQIHDRDAYVIVSKARTNGFFDTFFKVRDVNKSWLDTRGFYSHRFLKDIHEGHYEKKRMMDYFQQEGIVHIYKKDHTVEVEIPPFVLDVLSALYYTRTQNLTVGNDIVIDVNTGDKNWPLVVKVHRKETVEVPIGTFDCLVVEPMMRDEGIFETKGNITIWMTDDERHVPVLMKTKVLVGSITAELIRTIEKDTDWDLLDDSEKSN
ncbi:MAG: DUF3108 domain-containing protein [Elusimicrobia bacterium]|nr:DUF3108 domain-containing protein [Elusimicrobiota bacterium]